MDRSTRNIVVIAIVAFMASYVYSQNAQELFLRANKAYKNKRWSDAFSLYTSIEKKGRAVWYNMGNCWYKMGNPVKALLCWKRAVSGASLSEYADIENNCRAVYKNLGISCHNDHCLPWDRWATCVTPFLLQFLFLFCWYAFWMIWVLKPFRRVIRYTLVISLICILSMLGVLLVRIYHSQRYDKGIVTNRSAHLLAGPHKGYHTICAIPVAEELSIYEKRADWYKVAGNDSYGWIPFNDIEVI